MDPVHWMAIIGGAALFAAFIWKAAEVESLRRRVRKEWAKGRETKFRLEADLREWRNISIRRRSKINLLSQELKRLKSSNHISPGLESVPGTDPELSRNLTVDVTDADLDWSDDNDQTEHRATPGWLDPTSAATRVWRRGG